MLAHYGHLLVHLLSYDIVQVFQFEVIVLLVGLRFSVACWRFEAGTWWRDEGLRLYILIFVVVAVVLISCLRLFDLVPILALLEFGRCEFGVGLNQVPVVSVGTFIHRIIQLELYDSLVVERACVLSGRIVEFWLGFMHLFYFYLSSLFDLQILSVEAATIRKIFGADLLLQNSI